MAMPSTFRAAFRAHRAAATPKPRRTPWTVRAGRALATLLPTWRRVRTFTLSLAGFGCLTAAAWTIALPAGLLTLGVSLLLLEYLTGRP